jgi:NADPH:quinone reductase-like Zn-dependent oxidoreductase
MNAFAQGTRANKIRIKKGAYEGDTGKQPRPGLILAELEKPEPGLGEILIQVHAAGVTPNRIALVYHDTYEIRNSAHARCPRARIFGIH